MNERIEEAAQMGVLGLDPFKYIFSRDVNERLLMIELHNRMQTIENTRQTNLAIEIANQVGKLFKK